MGTPPIATKVPGAFTTLFLTTGVVDCAAGAAAAGSGARSGTVAVARADKRGGCP